MGLKTPGPLGNQLFLLRNFFWGAKFPTRGFPARFFIFLASLEKKTRTLKFPVYLPQKAGISLMFINKVRMDVFIENLNMLH